MASPFNSVVKRGDTFPRFIAQSFLIPSPRNLIVPLPMRWLIMSSVAIKVSGLSFVEQRR